MQVEYGDSVFSTTLEEVLNVRLFYYIYYDLSDSSGFRLKIKTNNKQNGGRDSLKNWKRIILNLFFLIIIFIFDISMLLIRLF